MITFTAIPEKAINTVKDLAECHIYVSLYGHKTHLRQLFRACTSYPNTSYIEQNKVSWNRKEQLQIVTSLLHMLMRNVKNLCLKRSQQLYTCKKITNKLLDINFSWFNFKISFLNLQILMPWNWFFHSSCRLIIELSSPIFMCRWRSFKFIVRTSPK